MRKTSFYVLAATAAFFLTLSAARADVLGREKADYIVLNNGDVLAGTVLNDGLVFRSFSGNRYKVSMEILKSVRINSERVWANQDATKTFSLMADSLTTVQETKLFGNLEESEILFRLKEGGEVKIKKSQIHTLTFDSRYAIY